MTPELAGKRLELLKEIIPKLSRVAVFWNRLQDQLSTISWNELELASKVVGSPALIARGTSSNDFDNAFRRRDQGRASALLPSCRAPVFDTHLTQIVGPRGKEPAAGDISREASLSTLVGLMAYGREPLPTCTGAPLPTWTRF